MIVYKDGKLYKHTYVAPKKIEFSIERMLEFRQEDCGCALCNPNNDREMPNRIKSRSYYLEDGEIGIAIYQDPDFDPTNPKGENLEIIAKNNVYGVMCMYTKDRDAMITRTNVVLDLNKIVFYSSLPSEVQNAFR